MSFKVKMNRGVSPAVRKAGMRGVAIGAEHIRGEALKLVPIEEHTLEESGTVTTDPKKLQAAVVFDTPYAVRQHEDLTLQHDPGRQAKYLETPFNAEKDTVNEIIAHAIRGEL